MDRKESSIEIVYFDLWPIVKIASAVFTVIGIIVGVLAFLVFPHPSSSGLTFSTRLLSALLFALLYTVIITLGITIVVGLYNFLSARLRWSVRIKTQETPRPE